MSLGFVYDGPSSLVTGTVRQPKIEIYKFWDDSGKIFWTTADRPGSRTGPSIGKIGLETQIASALVGVEI